MTPEPTVIPAPAAGARSAARQYRAARAGAVVELLVQVDRGADKGQVAERLGTSCRAGRRCCQPWWYT